MDIRPIKTEEEYRAMLAEVETLMDASPSSPEEARLEIMSMLVEAYEKKHYPILPPDPIEAIRYQMECRGLTRKDVEGFVGGRSHLSEVMGRKRPLSIEMIRNIHIHLDIPAEVLIQPYTIQKAAAHTKRQRALKSQQASEKISLTA